jgi:hypothetical protein
LHGTEPPTSTLDFPLRRWSEIVNDPAPTPLIGEWIAKGAFTAIYAPEWAGKSLIAQDIAFSLATVTRSGKSPSSKRRCCTCSLRAAYANVGWHGSQVTRMQTQGWSSARNASTRARSHSPTNVKSRRCWSTSSAPALAS